MPKAKLVTRATTTTSVTDDNLNKGSALSHAEMDSNLINLRDSGFTVADDTSTTLEVTNDKTITIAGSGSVTTSLSGDTLTISSTGTITALNNQAENRLTTIGSTTTELDGEANLTFDGSTLAVTGDVSATGNISNDAVSIADNKISTNRSNDDLLLAANGTGFIVSGGQASDFNDNQRYGHGRYYRETVDPTTMSSSNDQRRANHDEADYTISASSSGSNARFRKTQQVRLDMAGFDLTNSSSTYLSRGAQNAIFTSVDNTSGSSASTLANMQGVQTGIELYDTGGQGLTVNSAVGNSTYINVRSGVTVDNAYGYRTFLDKSGTATNWYAYYAYDNDQATNNYAFYTENADHLSAIGKLESYREQINTLTSDTTVSVDCGLAPVHKITLGHDTEFNISNLGTGQTATIIITQDGTGSRTATFGTDGSTAVKFAGGTPTLSTDADAIDVITVFNDGTNYLGNIAQAFAA